MGIPGGSVVKNLPAVQETQETWIRSLGQEDPLEEGMATHSSILAWRIPMDRGVWQAVVHRVAESDTPEATEYALAYTSIMGSHDPQPSVFDNNYMPV